MTHSHLASVLSALRQRFSLCRFLARLSLSILAGAFVLFGIVAFVDATAAFAATPTGISLSPTSGLTTGGTTVAITGAGFCKFITAPTVSFGGTNATSVTYNSTTSLSAVAPAHAAGTVSVTVTNPGGPCGGGGASTGASFTYLAPPTLTALSPAAGSSGTSVTITGTNFTATASVSFAGTPASALSYVSTTELIATAPAGSGSANVTVTTAAGTSATSVVDLFSYGAPSITSLTPTAGPTAGGTTVTITGTNFSSADTVKFGAAAAATTTVVSATEITARSPSGSGSVNLTVTNPDGTSPTSVSSLFSYGAPSITSLSPTSGSTAGGTVITITGANFSPGDTVSFAGTAGSAITVSSSTSLTVTAPAHAAGAVALTVANAAGTSTASSFTYLAPPTVTKLAPATGPASGGTSVTITGTNFTATASVSFAGTPASALSYVSTTELIATAPAGSGSANVTVTTAAGTSPSVAGDIFTYASLPTISAITPSNGPSTGGTTVTITGTNFSAGATVAFGTLAGTTVSVVSSTEITVHSPAGSGSVNITVTTTGGTSATSGADTFTYGTPPAITTAASASASESYWFGFLVDTSGTPTASITASGLPSGLSLTDNGDGTAEISGAPTESGTFTATITATNTVGSVSQSFSFTIAPFTLAVPTLATITPAAGPAGTATVVTITGTNLLGATAVNFGTTVVTTGITVSSDGTTLTVTAPTLSPTTNLTVDVTVTTPAGVTAPSIDDEYEFAAAVPTVTSVSPNSGSIAGGDLVTITGTGFTYGDDTEVDFGTIPGAVIAETATSIVVSTPIGVVGTVNVTVSDSGGTSAISSADQFTYENAIPSVSAISLTSGGSGGGDLITITGTGFTSASTVDFGPGNLALVSVDLSETEILAVAPAGSGTVNVTVSNGAGTSATGAADEYTYTTVPTVTSVAPTSGNLAGGDLVTITGSDFDSASAVNFGGAPASFTILSDETILATTPPGSLGSVNVTVVTPTGSSATSSADTFTYASTPPVVSLIDPAAGSATGGDTIAISGSGLSSTTAVFFGGAPASFTVISDDVLSVTVPAGLAGETVDVTVTSGDGTSAITAADQFTYAPLVSAVQASSGSPSGGTTVTITGSGFSSATGVNFGSLPATSFTVNSDTSITAVTPAEEPGTVDVTILVGGAASPETVGDEYSFGPVITAITPMAGAPGGTTTVTITGSGFTAATSVYFGPNAATSFSVNSDTSITAIAPSGTGTVDIVVTTPSQGSSARGTSDLYTYAAPGVTGITPNSGVSSGGTVVTITGYGFSTDSSVTFGGVSATSVTYISPTELTAISPAGAGPVDVVVSNDYAESAITAADQFTYGAPVVTAITPASGLVSGGTVVTITGTDFTATSTVDFGATEASAVTFVSATELIATAPASQAGPVDITVTSATATSTTGAADLFTYLLPDTMTLVPSLSSTVSGEDDSLTATLSGAAGATPTGSVTFSDGLGQSFTVALVDGSASASFAETAPGAVTITATYSGDATYEPQSATATITVSQAATTTTASATSSVVVGESDLVTVTVAPISPGAGIPTGSVTLSDGLGQSYTLGLDGSASASVAFTEMAPGSDTITVTYSGDANFAASSTTAVITINQAESATFAYAGSPTVVVGTGDVITAAVYPQAPSTGTPTGTLTFSDGLGQSYTETLVDGSATATFAELTGGPTTISITYSGDANYAASATTVALTVDAPPAITSPTTASAVIATPFSFTVTTSGYPVASLVASGLPSWLSFTDNGNGTATLTGTAPAGSAGTVAIAIDAFNGTNPDAPETLTVTIASAPDTMTLVPSLSSTVSGEDDSLTATLSGAAGATPTGSVTFSDGLGQSFTVALVDGSASASFAETAPGAVTITATYSGDASYEPQSATATITVSQAATTTTASATSSVVVGESDLVTVTVAPISPGAGIPTGSVTLSDGLGQSYTLGLDGSASASVAFTEMAPGSDTITVTYSGDANFAASSTTAVITINQAESATFAYAGSPTVVVGTGDVITAAVYPQAPSTGTPTGTLTFSDGLGQSYTETLVDGSATATFAELTGGPTTISITYSGDANYAASATTVALTVDAPPAITSPTTASAVIATPFSFTVTTSGYPVASLVASGLPSWLSFTDNGNGTATLTGTAPAGSAGTVAIAIDAFNGTNPDAPETLTVTIASAPDTMTLVPSLSSTVSGEDDSLTATLSGAAGATPTGSVTFSDGLGQSFTVALVDGSASASFAETAPGAVTITATYSGDATYEPQSATATITVSQAATTTTASATSSVVVGESDLVTVTVAPISPGAGIPTGSVTLSDGLGQSYTLGLDGSASASVAFTEMAPGSDTITVTYSGDANFAASSTTAVITINQAESATFAYAGSPTVVVGTGDVITAAVYPQAPSTGTPTGTLTFSDGLGQSYTETLVDGSATATFAELTGGPTTISITYSGDANYAASATTVALTVDAPPAITSPTTASAVIATPFSFTVTTSGYPVASLVASGLPSWLSFTDNGNGTATLTGTAPAGSAGTVAIAIDAFNGTNPDAPETLTVTIASAPDTMTLVPSLSSTVSGEDDSLTATLSGAAGATPTGSVTFSDGLGQSFTVALVDGSASASFAETAPGAVTITATYSGDASYEPQSATATITVSQAATTTTASATSSVVVGESDLVTVTVAPISPGAGIPTGSVTLSDGLGQSYTLGLDGSASASVAFTEMAPGSDTITVTYSGDANFAASSTTAVITINQAESATFAYAGSPTVVVGTGDVITAAVYPQAPSTGTPTGTLTFSDGLGQSYTETLVDGSATATFAELTGGPTTISITYSGDANYAASATTVALTVDAPPAITSPTTASAVIATPFSFTVTTSGYPVASLVASGLPSWLSFTDNGNGTATLTGTAPAGSAGTVAIAIDAFNGTNPDAPETLTVTIASAPDTMTLVPSLSSTVSGEDDSLTATLSGAAGATPTGSVTFSDGLGQSFTVALVDGSASASFAETAPGAVTITATYSGDATYEPQSATATITVSQAATTTTASATSSVVVGESDLVTVTVAPISPGAGIPTGSVTLSDGLGQSYTLGLDGSASASVAFTEMAPGSDTITVTYSGDANFAASSTTAVITINQAPAITSGATVTATIGQPFSFTVTTSGAPTPDVTIDVADLPSWLSVTTGNGTATLTGTPPPGSAGTVVVYLEATNGIAPYAPSSLTITVSSQAVSVSLTPSATSVLSGTPDTVTATVTPAGTATGTATGTVTFSDGLGQSFTETLVGGSASATFTEVTPGTPTITATYSGDLTYAPSTSTAAITVTGAAPLITSPSSVTATVGEAFSFTVTTSGSPTPAVSVYTGNLPAWLSVTLNSDGTATLSGTPPPSAVGSITIYLEASNGIAPYTTSTLTLTVPAAAPAITSPDTATATVGQAFSFTVTASGAPTPAVSVYTGNLPTWLSVTLNSDGTATLSGTPPPSAVGSITIYLEATNGTATYAASTLSLTVPAAAPAITSPDTATATVGQAFSFTVTASGAPTPAVSVYTGNLPTWLSVTLNSDGTATLTGTPPPSAVGSITIYLEATNGTATYAASTLSLTVPAAAPAITSPDTATATVGQAFSFTVTASGAPTPAVSVYTGNLPTWLSVTLNSDGTATLTGTPPPSAVGSITIYLEATNGTATYATSTLSLTVPAAAPAITSPDTATATVGQAFSFTVTTSGAPTPAVSIDTADLPTWLSVTLNGDGTATITGTPPLGAVGVVTIYLEATNGTATYAAGTITLSVGSETPTLLLTSPSTSAVVGAPEVFTATVSAPDGTPTGTVTLADGLGQSYTETLVNGSATATFTETAPGAVTITATYSGDGNDSALSTTTPITIDQDTTTTTVAASLSSTLVASGDLVTVTVAASSPGSGTPTGTVTLADGLGQSYTETLVNGSATATFTETAPGAVTITATYSGDGNFAASSASTTITVDAPPAITSPDTATATVGQAFSFTVTASGTPTPDVSVYTAGLPSWLSATTNANGTVTLSGTPPATATGTVAIYADATNGVNPYATQTITLTVQP